MKTNRLLKNEQAGTDHVWIITKIYPTDLHECEVYNDSELAHQRFSEIDASIYRMVSIDGYHLNMTSKGRLIKTSKSTNDILGGLK